MNNLLKDFKIQPTKLRGENMEKEIQILTRYEDPAIKQLQQELEETKEMHKTMAKYALENEAKIDLLKAQQKEFIKYLEDETNDIKEQIKNYDIWHEVGTDINFLILKKQFNEEILSKYKEIVGVEDVR